MTDDRRRRGRPKGSEIDDSEMLTAVADLLVAHPDMKPTTAMRRIKRDASTAEIHRWQDKWKRRGTDLLTAAKSRAKEVARKTAEREAREETRVSGIDILKFASGFPGFPSADPLWRFVDSPQMRMFRELQSSGTLRAMWDLQKSPEMEAARRLIEETREARRAAAAHLNDPSTKEAIEALSEQRDAIKIALGEARF